MQSSISLVSQQQNHIESNGNLQATTDNLVTTDIDADPPKSPESDPCAGIIKPAAKKPCEISNPCPQTKKPPIGSKEPFVTLYRRACKNDFPGDLDCEEDPCAAFNELKAAEEAKKKCDAKKKQQVQVKRKQEKKTKKKENGDKELEKPENDQEEKKEESGNTDSKSEDSDGLKKCDKKKGKGKEEEPVKFSKKYLKMKYEIELQNYWIDKMNRDLKSKTLKCRPEKELCRLKKKIKQEIKKLEEMVQFAISLQRGDPTEKWGPIPISPIAENALGKKNPCPRESKTLQPPVTPSDISNLSGFTALDDILVDNDEEACLMQKEIEAKGNQIKELCTKLKNTKHDLMKLMNERKLLNVQKCPPNPCDACDCDNEVKCDEIFEPNKTNDLVENVKAIKTVDEMVRKMIKNIETIKCSAKKLHDEMDCLKQKNFQAKENDVAINADGN